MTLSACFCRLGTLERIDGEPDGKKTCVVNSSAAPETDYN